MGSRTEAARFDVKKTEKGIIFGKAEVRALLDGRKTQTRRVIRPQPTFDRDRDQWEWRGKRGIARWGPAHHQPVLSALHYGLLPECPHGVPGDRLWVRETWQSTIDLPPWVLYRADGAMLCPETGKRDAFLWSGPWTPSIHMPRWASRITLELTAVRVERLQGISEADAVAEGGEWMGPPGGLNVTGWRGHCFAFTYLWDSLNTKRALWASNPWVWVLEFKRVTP